MHSATGIYMVHSRYIEGGQLHGSYTYGRDPWSPIGTQGSRKGCTRPVPAPRLMPGSIYLFCIFSHGRRQLHESNGRSFVFHRGVPAKRNHIAHHQRTRYPFSRATLCAHTRDRPTLPPARLQAFLITLDLRRRHTTLTSKRGQS